MDGDRQIVMDGDRQIVMDGDRQIVMDGDRQIVMDGDRQIVHPIQCQVGLGLFFVFSACSFSNSLQRIVI